MVVSGADTDGVLKFLFPNKLRKRTEGAAPIPSTRSFFASSGTWGVASVQCRTMPAALGEQGLGTIGGVQVPPSVSTIMNSRILAGDWRDPSFKGMTAANGSDLSVVCNVVQPGFHITASIMNVTECCHGRCQHWTRLLRHEGEGE